MKRTFGEMEASKPKGMLAEIQWPVLAELNQSTNEGFISRMLDASGGTVRELPRTGYHQFKQAEGHSEAPAFSSVREVTFNQDEETGRQWLSGRGWVIDDEVGRRAALQIQTKVLFHNSIDLAEVDVDIDFIETEDDYKVLAKFVQWAFAATTSVGKPAFRNAHAVIPEEIAACMALALDDDEITASLDGDVDPYEFVASLSDDQVSACLDEICASLGDGPLAMGFAETHVNFDAHLPMDELVAAGSTVPAWGHFHLPEPDKPTPWFIGDADENGHYSCWGHLGTWESCHDGFEAQCVMIPRPPDGYASFNQSGVITDRGTVETGPVFFRGGHPSRPVGDGDFAKAYGDVDNCVADVRVIPGVFGPWACGVVRPGRTDEDIYAARASRVSGHWKGGKLRAVVCVNSEGYNVPGSGELEVAASMTFTVRDGEIDELVASLPPCTEAAQDEGDKVLTPYWNSASGTSLAELTSGGVGYVGPNFVPGRDVWSGQAFVPGIFVTKAEGGYDLSIANPTESDSEPADEPQVELEAQRLALELDLEDDAD